MRVLSGIQPTGRFHWGNYFGAIKQYIDFQEAHDGYYFIADLHALTTIRDPGQLRGYVQDAALDLLALGLDPERATLFVQSDVPEVSQLCWLLMTGAPLGLLERCTAYKDKTAKGLRGPFRRRDIRESVCTPRVPRPTSGGEPSGQTARRHRAEGFAQGDAGRRLR